MDHKTISDKNQTSLPANQNQRKLAVQKHSGESSDGAKSDCEATLIRLFNKKRITEQELRAGMCYIMDFKISGMMGYFSKTHYENISINNTPFPHANDNFTPTERQIVARQRLARIEARLGKLSASCLNHVLGLGMTVKDWAHKLHSGNSYGLNRKLNAEQAMGVLLAAISSLAESEA